MENQMRANVLYVDDEISNLTSFKATFRRFFNVYTATNAADAIIILQEQKIHVVISDQRMPGTTGVVFLEKVTKDYANTIRIILTGYADIEVVINAINKGEVYRYLTKPWNEDELKKTIEAAYSLYLEREKEKALTEILLETNKQLEFQVRQVLLS